MKLPYNPALWVLVRRAKDGAHSWACEPLHQHARCTVRHCNGRAFELSFRDVGILDPHGSMRHVWEPG